MSVTRDRARAIALLKEARDILAHRLTERILENGDELLEDAMGRTYSSEIDGIYEQIGLRLSHINLMLSSLPPKDDEPAPCTTAATELPVALEWMPLDQPGVYQADTSAELMTHVAAEPRRAALEVTALPAPVSMEQFALHIGGDDLAAAGRSLAVLFAVDEERGRRCAATFHEQLHASPETLTKALRLRHELQCGSANNALALLRDCFGLQGLESIRVLQTLQSRLTL